MLVSGTVGGFACLKYELKGTIPSNTTIHPRKEGLLKGLIVNHHPLRRPLFVRGTHFFAANLNLERDHIGELNTHKNCLTC